VTLEAKTSFKGYPFDLLDVEASQLYLSTSSLSGLLVVDVTNIADPHVTHSARILSYISRIVPFDGKLLRAAGRLRAASY
jgi:hypothetical protein